jgi:hypothetical protein
MLTGEKRILNLEKNAKNHCKTPLFSMFAIFVLLVSYCHKSDFFAFIFNILRYFYKNTV